MAKKPQNDIEKLLSDYAKQRRDDAGTPELHPATRRLLQSEVRRQHPASDDSNTLPTRSRWSIFWPRFAAACGILAALATVVVIVNPPERDSSSMEMARVEEDPLTTASPAAPTPRTVAVPEADLAVSDRTEPGPPIATKGAAGFGGGGGGATAELSARNVTIAGDVGEKPEAAANFAATPVDGERRWAADSNESLAGMGGRTGGGRGGGMGGSPANRAVPVDSSNSQPLLAAAAPRPVMTKAGGDVEPVAAAGQMSKSAASAPTLATDQFLNNSMTQRYRNVVMVEGRTAVTNVNAAVLDEFTVEQNGRELKVVDRDGSVYHGFVQPAPAESATNIMANGPAEPMVAANADGMTVQSAAESQAMGTAMAVQPAQVPVLAQSGVAVQAQNFSEPQNYFFRVEGTNRSLQQRVVFTGNMIQNTVDPGLNNLANTQRFRQQNQVQQAPGMNTLNLQMQNNFINGRVTLDDSRMSTEMNALQVEP